MFHVLHRRHFILPAFLGLACVLGATVASADDTPYFGRWTVSDDKPVFTAKGKLYKTVDIAPCGNDFCGVSVDDKNQCGPTLFRFLTIHAKNEQLVGHGLWGDARKKIEIDYVKPEADKPYVMLGLGADDMDFTGREGSMPTYQANYKTTGQATCMAK